MSTSVEDEGKAIAEALGVIYTGPQYDKEELCYHLFTDPLTSGTFAATTKANAWARFFSLREQFNAPLPDNIPPEWKEFVTRFRGNLTKGFKEMGWLPAVSSQKGLVNLERLKSVDLPNVRVAGSYAQGIPMAQSDVDILIGLTDEEWAKVSPREPPEVLNRILHILPEEKLDIKLYKLSDVKDMWYFQRGRKLPDGTNLSGVFLPVEEKELVQGLWNSSVALNQIPISPEVRGIQPLFRITGSRVDESTNLGGSFLSSMAEDEFILHSIESTGVKELSRQDFRIALEQAEELARSKGSSRINVMSRERHSLMYKEAGYIYDDARQSWTKVLASTSPIASTHPLVIERFPHPAPDEEDLMPLPETFLSELEKLVPGFQIYAYSAPLPKSRIFDIEPGTIDDREKVIRLIVWDKHSPSDVKAILAHEVAHLQPGTSIYAKGLRESEVWRRGEVLARKWGVLPEYLSLAQTMLEQYERALSQGIVVTPRPGLSREIRSWLSSHEGAIPLVLERFPHPGPEEMELGGDIGKLKITIPPPRGTPVPPKKVGITVAPEAPQVITMEDYDRDWKPKGWKLLAIGPTSTWRQDWGMWEAIRDIVQNALDETEAYQWGYDEQGLWISDNGRGVSVVDFLLGPPKLKPEYARGRYGEGMKISTLVMVRNGYPVHITTVEKELWVVFLELDIDGVKSHQLNALYKKNGTTRGTVFHIIGYTGGAFENYFAVNLPKEDILWEGSSLVTKPKQRFNQLIAPQSPGNMIYARDIYMREIRSPYSYNLWSFTLAPDRHAPADESQVWLDIGRLWATVNDVDLLETFLKMVVDPPIIASDEGHSINMSRWELGSDPSSGMTYEEIIKKNTKAWRKAWYNVCGENAIIRTKEKLDNTIKHLGYKSVSLTWGVKDSLSKVIDTDIKIMEISQEKLRESEVVSDEKLDERQRKHLGLAREIAADILGQAGISGVYAALIPPASDLVRTAGLYGTTTQTIYINLDILYKGRDTMDTLIHEMGHHRQFRQTGEAEDLTESHATAMTSIAADIVQKLAKGYYKEHLQNIVW